MYGWTTFSSSILLSMHTWVAFIFWLVRIMLLWTWVYSYLFKTLLSVEGGNILQSRIAGSYFNFLRIWCTIFHSSYTTLHSQQYIRGQISPYPCLYLLFPFFIVTVIVLIFYSRHPNGYEVVSHFDLHFYYDWWY